MQQTEPTTAFANQEALTDTLLRMLGLADALFAISETGVAEQFADSALLGVQAAIRRDVSDLLEAAQAHEIGVKPEAPATASGLLVEIGDELASLRARASLLETALVEIDGAALAGAHDALNQQATDIASGLDSLLRRIDETTKGEVRS